MPTKRVLSTHSVVNHDNEPHFKKEVLCDRAKIDSFLIYASFLMFNISALSASPTQATNTNLSSNQTPTLSITQVSNVNTALLSPPSPPSPTPTITSLIEEIRNEMRHYQKPVVTPPEHCSTSLLPTPSSQFTSNESDSIFSFEFEPNTYIPLDIFKILMNKSVQLIHLKTTKSH